MRPLVSASKYHFWVSKLFEWRCCNLASDSVYAQVRRLIHPLKIYSQRIVAAGSNNVARRAGVIAVHLSAEKQLFDPVHTSPGARTRVIPSSIRSKLETSRCRCFAPAGVSL